MATTEVYRESPARLRYPTDLQQAMIRTDRHGRAMPLSDRAPTRPTVVITGAAGDGRTTELYRSAAAAANRGCLMLHFDGHDGDGLRLGFVSAVHGAARDLKGLLGRSEARRLRKVAQDLVATNHARIRTTDARWWYPPVMIGRSFGRALYYTAVKSSLTDLAKAYGQAAAGLGTGVLVSIDNVSDLSDDELGQINGLATALSKGSCPGVVLAMAGGPGTVGQLQAARGDVDIPGVYDVCDLAPLNDGQVARLIVGRLEKRGVAVPSGRDGHLVASSETTGLWRLVHAANGSPRRIERLVNEAVGNVGPGRVLDAMAAVRTVRWVDQLDKSTYAFRWAKLEPTEKRLLRRLAPLAAEAPAEKPNAAAVDELDSASLSLRVKGLLRDEPGRGLVIEDPGFMRWITRHMCTRETDLGIESAVRAAEAALPPPSSAAAPDRATLELQGEQRVVRLGQHQPGSHGRHHRQPGR